MYNVPFPNKLPIRHVWLSISIYNIYCVINKLTLLCNIYDMLSIILWGTYMLYVWSIWSYCHKVWSKKKSNKIYCKQCFIYLIEGVFEMNTVSNWYFLGIVFYKSRIVWILMLRAFFQVYIHLRYNMFIVLRQ